MQRRAATAQSSSAPERRGYIGSHPFNFVIISMSFDRDQGVSRAARAPSIAEGSGGHAGRTAAGRAMGDADAAALAFARQRLTCTTTAH